MVDISGSMVEIQWWTPIKVNRGQHVFAWMGVQQFSTNSRKSGTMGS